MATLFHYCSASSFFSIIRGREIWLSSLRQSNDSLEGKLASQTLMKLAFEDKDVSEYQRQHLQDALQHVESSFDGLGFCLSRQGDILSQWRGYANDATGLSIGFSERYLNDYCSSTVGESSKYQVRLEAVEYDPTTHAALVKETYESVKSLIKEGAFDYRRALIGGLLDLRTEEEIEKEKKEISGKSFAALLTLHGILPKLFSLKSPAFREEEELRLISNMVSSPKLHVPRHCLFRYSRNQVIPYRVIPLTDFGSTIIDKVILGPKHETPIEVIQIFLLEQGFQNVAVEKSTASYR